MHQTERRPRPLAMILAAALAAFASLASCAANLTLAVNPDGSGTLAVDARIPESAAARLRSYSAAGTAGSGPVAPLFDPAAVRREADGRGLATISAELPSPDRFRGSFSFRSLAAVAADPELAKAGILRAGTTGGETTLSFRLSRDNAESLPLLFPGLDPYVLEALSPPALDPYPATPEEYREMLGALLGSAALRELEAAEIRVQIRTPGPIVRRSGGSVSERTFTAVIRQMDLLILETPIEFSVSWK